MKTKNYFSFIALLLIALFVSSCNNDDDNNNRSDITTLDPTIIEGYVNLGCEVSRAGEGLYKVGVCWSETPGPTVTGERTEELYTHLGVYQFPVFTLKSNTVYYLRSYAEYYESGEIEYGNEITYTSPSSLKINSISEISLKAALIRFSSGLDQSVVDETVEAYGIVYGTGHNPTLQNFVVYTNLQNTNSAFVSLSGLTPATVFYARAFLVYNDGSQVYSDEMEFKTTGYPGPGGGLVVYDTGNYDFGMRYIEMYMTPLTYDISLGEGAHWGENVNVQGLDYNFSGENFGYSNTEIITGSTTSDNCAAKLCYDFVSNGQSDWYLGVPYEMEMLLTNLRSAGYTVPDRVWSSYGFNSDVALSVKFNGNTYISENYNTNQNTAVLALRRY